MITPSRPRPLWLLLGFLDDRKWPSAGWSRKDGETTDVGTKDKTSSRTFHEGAADLMPLSFRYATTH